MLAGGWSRRWMSFVLRLEEVVLIVGGVHETE